jgi:hypothetical protein
MTNTRRIITTGLACLLLASPAAAAQPTPFEQRVLDTRSAAERLYEPSGSPHARAERPRQDLRSPDTRDAAERPAHLRARDAAWAADRPVQDLRSPDARDVADPTPPVAGPVSVPSQPVEVPSPGTDWTLIILAASGYLLAIALVALGALRGRRRVAV